MKQQKTWVAMKSLLSLACFGSSSILLVFRFVLKRKTVRKHTFREAMKTPSFKRKKNKGTTIIKSPNPSFQGIFHRWGWGTPPTMPVVRIASEGLLQMSGSIPWYSNVYILGSYLNTGSHWIVKVKNGFPSYKWTHFLPTFVGFVQGPIYIYVYIYIYIDPPTIDMKPESATLEKETHLQTTNLWVPAVHFRGVFFHVFSL